MADFLEKNMISACAECGYLLPKIKVVSVVGRKGSVRGAAIVICCPKCGRAHHSLTGTIPVEIDSWYTGGVSE